MANGGNKAVFHSVHPCKSVNKSMLRVIHRFHCSRMVDCILVFDTGDLRIDSVYNDMYLVVMHMFHRLGMEDYRQVVCSEDPSIE